MEIKKREQQSKMVKYPLHTNQSGFHNKHSKKPKSHSLMQPNNKGKNYCP